MTPKISIIVPCYNQAQYLDECLQSVLDQTFVDWECIIINDGSPDNTEAIAKSWELKDSRFKYFYTDNKGVSNARNLGIQNSSGGFIQFLDSDDILEREKINYQLEILQNNTHIDIVYSSSRYFFSENKSVLFPIHYKGVVPTIEMHFKDTTQKEVLFYKNICTICSTLYRKEIFKNISFKNIVYEDWYFHIECAFNGFIFHFTTAENCNSLIRMTPESQMLKHEIQNSNSNFFQDLLKQLIAEKKFTSTLNDFRDRNKTQVASKKNNLKSIVIDLIPPIALKMYHKIKKKIKHRRGLLF